MYEVKIQYTRFNGEDNPEQVKETYIVDAVSCSDAEKKIIEYITPYMFTGGECDAPQVKKVNFFDIFFCANTENWYKAKIDMIVVEGDKELRKGVNVLQQANTLSGALQALKLNYADYDCEIVSVSKTTIAAVLPRQEVGA